MQSLDLTPHEDREGGGGTDTALVGLFNVGLGDSVSDVRRKLGFGRPIADLKNVRAGGTQYLEAAEDRGAFVTFTDEAILAGYGAKNGVGLYEFDLGAHELVRIEHRAEAERILTDDRVGNGAIHVDDRGGLVNRFQMLGYHNGGADTNCDEGEYLPEMSPQHPDVVGERKAAVRRLGVLL